MFGMRGADARTEGRSTDGGTDQGTAQCRGRSSEGQVRHVLGLFLHLFACTSMGSIRKSLVPTQLQCVLSASMMHALQSFFRALSSSNLDNSFLTIFFLIHIRRCLYCYPLPSRRSQADNSQASFGGVSHRSIHSHHLIPDAAVSHTSFNSAPVASHRSGGGGGGQYVSSSRSVSSDHQQHLTQQQHYAMNYHQNSASGSMASLGSLGDMSPRHHPTHGRHRLSDLPDTIESASVASNPSIASTTSAAQLAADQVAIEDAIARFETENADLCDILATMRRFPRSVRVQELGCEKLWIQSWDDENSSAIGRVGGIPTIIDSMRTHAGSAHLQQCGCEALQNLALNNYNREVIAEQGGIIAVIDAMGRHWDVAGVQQCESTALISRGILILAK